MGSSDSLTIKGAMSRQSYLLLSKVFKKLESGSSGSQEPINLKSIAALCV